MPMSEQKRSKVWVPLIVSFILLLGFGLGVITQKYLINTKPLEKFLEREDPIDEIISLINNEYVDTVNKDSLYIEAVNGILSKLDPHTVYIPANQVAQANEILEGTGKGIGIEYFFLRDTMMITDVAKASPAQKAGLKIGDRLLKVNGKVISGPEITEEEAVKHFGDSDTLNLLILHPNAIAATHIKLVKGTVMNSSVSAAQILPNTRTGYIKIDIFSSGVYDETVNAIDRLRDQGMKNLIVDVRDNGGGYLEEAANIADEFISGKKILVTINSKRDGKYDFSSYNKGVFEEGRLIILIDENSASASEILAGAVQDWDRGIIIGMNSYGKGLIQEQYDLSDGSAIRLTTGRYYTPSGRSIQRSYANGKLAYQQDYYNRLNDSLIKSNTNGTIYYTLLKHRAIFGNGGIFPDVVVRTDLKPHSGELQQMMDNFVFDNYINTYFFTDYKINFSFKDFNDFKNHFEIDDAFMEKMRQYFIRQDAIFTERIWNDDDDLFYLRVQSKAQIAKLAYGISAYNQIHIQYDNCIQRALLIINSEEYNDILQSSTTQ